MSIETQRPLTEAEKSKLADLTAAVTAAIEARRDWLDAKMRETSRLQVGDDIYDVNKGRCLGVVSKLYRHHREQRNDLLDTSVSCDYEYETRPRSFDNTSRQPGVSFGTREDAARRAEVRAVQLRA